MNDTMLLIDIATPDAAAQVTPAPIASAAWVPSAYLANALTAPVGFSAVGVIDGVAVSWTAPPPGVATIIERAPDASGLPGVWAEVARVTANATTVPATAGTAFWYRAAHLRFGITSPYSAQISITAVQSGQLQADIAAAAAAAAAAQSGVTGNATAIDALSHRVDTVEDTTVAQAASITALQASVTTKNSVKTQANPPAAAGLTIGDIWIDSDDENKVYVWDGSLWVESSDGRINQRNRVFAQNAAPAGTFIINDLWVDTDDGNSLHRWNGTTWVDATDSRTMANAAATSVLTTRVTNIEGVNTAQANSLTTLNTTVNGLSATVTTQGSSIDGLMANYSLNLDVNGFITGYEFNNDGTTGDFKVRADKFTVVKPTGGADTVTLAGGVLYAETGTFGRYMGAGFGVGGVYTDWAGPKPASLAAAADAGAKFWIKKDGSAYFGGLVNLSIAGSGAQVGDQRTIPPINVGSVGSRWDGLSLSSSVPATGSPASVTISASAATLRAGSVSVSYSAASAVVSQARSTTVTYQAYYLDASYSGGAKSLNVTTNPNNIANSDAVIWVGSITVVVPPAGTSGGGGGEPGGGCVDIAMWLRPGLTAGSALAGDDIECSMPAPDASGTQMLRVQASRITIQPCYRLTSASGAQVIASDSTPMTLIDGTTAYVPDMLGLDVLVIDADGQRWEPVVECRFIGNRPVARISVNEHCYFAGVEANRRIATHNATQKP